MYHNHVGNGIEHVYSIAELSLNYTYTQNPEQRISLTNGMHTYSFIKPYFGNDLEIKEKVFVIMLNQANHIIGIAKVAEGGIDKTIVDIRIILCIALQSLATQIIICHNHPSGQLKPSKADIEMTANLNQACQLLNIRLLDHIIITQYNYYSFSSNGMM